ncbi:uncharacterized protein LOC144916742 [Branchiostoma floridae x Branchiostoma belcheri]
MVFQALNKVHPNSKDNTTIFCVFEAKDYRENLTTALQRFKTDIQAIQGHRWRSHDEKEFQVKVLAVGDYAFLSMIYGISGACGTHPCLWCPLNKEQILDKDDQPLRVRPRTLETLARHHQQFIQEGQGKITKAKDYHNVISPTMFPIPINHVIVPGLHVSLGIFLKLYKLLETELHTMDMRLQSYLQSVLMEEEMDRGDITADPHLVRFKAYIDAIDKAEAYQTQADDLEEEIEESESQLAWLAFQQDDHEDPSMTEVVFQEAVDMVTKLREKRDNLEEKAAGILAKASVKRGKGPLTSKLEPVLRQYNVHPQAYHSRSFIGNHVNKMLQVSHCKNVVLFNSYTNIHLPAFNSHPSKSSNPNCCI